MKIVTLVKMDNDTIENMIDNLENLQQVAEAMDRADSYEDVRVRNVDTCSEFNFAEYISELFEAVRKIDDYVNR